MTLRSVARSLSGAYLCLATGLAMWGIYGMSRFQAYSGVFYDPRFVVFDNGLYPFLWGGALLVLGQLCRLKDGRYATLFVSVTGLLVFGWKRLTVPLEGNGQKAFPDEWLLIELLLICVALAATALADRYLQRAFGNHGPIRGPST